MKLARLLKTFILTLGICDAKIDIDGIFGNLSLLVRPGQIFQARIVFDTTNEGPQHSPIRHFCPSKPPRKVTLSVS